MDDMLRIAGHLAALVAVAWLALRAPDYIQLGFLTVAFTAISVLTVESVMAMLGMPRTWEIRSIGYSYLYLAFLIYLFRQLWLKTEICKSLKSGQQ